MTMELLMGLLIVSGANAPVISGDWTRGFERGAFTLDGEPFLPIAPTPGQCKKLNGSVPHLQLDFEPRSVFELAAELLSEWKSCGVASLRMTIARGFNGSPASHWLTRDAPTELVLSESRVFFRNAHGKLPRGGRARAEALRRLMALGPPTLIVNPGSRFGSNVGSLGDVRERPVPFFLQSEIETLPPDQRETLRVAMGKETSGESNRADGALALAQALGDAHVYANVEADFPAWTFIGVVHCKTGEGSKILGVGSMGPMENEALAARAADNRARNEVGKFWSIHQTEEKSGGTRSLKTFSSSTVSGIAIVDHFWAPDGTVYSLALGTPPEGMAEARLQCPEGTRKRRVWGRLPAPLDDDELIWLEGTRVVDGKVFCTVTIDSTALEKARRPPDRIAMLRTLGLTQINRALSQGTRTGRSQCPELSDWLQKCLPFDRTGQLIERADLDVREPDGHQRGVALASRSLSSLGDDWSRRTGCPTSWYERALPWLLDREIRRRTDSHETCKLLSR